MAEMKGHQLFDGRATVKLNQPVARHVQEQQGEVKSGSGKILFLAIAVAVVALIFMLK